MQVTADESECQVIIAEPHRHQVLYRMQYDPAQFRVLRRHQTSQHGDSQSIPCCRLRLASGTGPAGASQPTGMPSGGAALLPYILRSS